MCLCLPTEDSRWTAAVPACDVPYREQDAWVPQWVLQAKAMEVGVMEDPWTQIVKGGLEVLGV